MIQLISGLKAFHSAISKTKFGVKEVISFDSLHKILISSALWMRKQVYKKKKSRDLRTKLCKQFDLLKTSKNKFFHRTTCQFVEEFGRDYWMHLFIFDQRLILNACSRMVIIKVRTFIRR